MAAVRPENRRSFPNDIIFQNFRTVPRGTSDWRMAGVILAHAWADSKPVYLLSTIHDPEYPENFTGKQTVLRRGKGKGESLAVPAPPPPSFTITTSTWGRLTDSMHLGNIIL